MPGISRANAINTLGNMVIPFGQRLVDIFSVPVALVLALLAMPVQAALDRGDFTGGLYTAPGQFFTVKSPLGPRPALFDGFEQTVGSVIFMDDFGQFFGVVCTPDLDVLAGAKIDKETSQAILRNWFRDTAFPAFFVGSVPGSTILRDEPGEFEGQPAWIAVMHLPGNAPSAQLDITTGRLTRADSWRGAVIFSRGGHTYLLMTEAMAPSSKPDHSGFDASAPGWDNFLPRLAQFYGGMTFQASEPEEQEVPRVAQRPDPDVQSRSPSTN